MPMMSHDERVEELTHLIVSSRRAMHTNESGGAERELARRIVDSGYRQLGQIPAEANVHAIPVDMNEVAFMVRGSMDGTLNITSGIDRDQLLEALEFIVESIRNGAMPTGE